MQVRLTACFACGILLLCAPVARGVEGRRPGRKPEPGREMREDPDAEALERKALEALEKQVSIKSPDGGMGIAKVLEEIRGQAGIDYVVSAEVGGEKVILNVENKPVRAVLAAVSRATGYEWEMPPGEMVVSVFKPRRRGMDFFFPPEMLDEGEEGPPRPPWMRRPREGGPEGPGRPEGPPRGDDAPDDKF